MAEKQLIVVVEGTAALGPYWQTIVSDYLEKIIRSFCSNELTGQRASTSTVELSLVNFNSHGSYCACLVQRSGWTKDVDIFLQWLSCMPFGGGGFNDAATAEGLAEALMMFSVPSNGSQNQQAVDMKRHCILVAASNPHSLPTPVYRPQMSNLEQNDNMEGQMESRLSDAETIAKYFAMCSVSLSIISPKQLPKIRTIYNAGKRNPQAADPHVDNVRNPYFLVLISENFTEARAALSRSAPNLIQNQSPVKADRSAAPSVGGPTPASVPSVNGSIMGRQPISAGNVPSATVKVEPSTVTSITSGPTFPNIQSMARPVAQGVPNLQTSSPSTASQDVITGSDNAQDVKPVVSGMTQPMRAGPTAANVNILNNLSQVRQVMNSAALAGAASTGLQSIGQTPVAMHMSNMISNGVTSSVPPTQTVFSSGPSGVTGSGTLSGTSQVVQSSTLNSFTSPMSNVSGNANIGVSQPMGTLQGGASAGQAVPGMSQGAHSGPQMVQSSIGMSQNMITGLGQSNVSSGTGPMMPTPGIPQQVQSGAMNSAANMPSQHTSSSLQSSQSKYVKVWEGDLSGQRQGQPVLITRLEGYRNASASDTLAANWPPTMQIVRLISQDHMNNKQYVGKADFLVFRAMSQHGFLGQLQEKKLCAVIQLPSQTLLLSVSDKAQRLIGMLFPGDMVVFKPQIPNQQQLQHQQHHQQQQQQQRQPQLPQLQQQPQLQPQMGQLQPSPPQQQQQMVGSGIGQAYVQGPGRSQLVSQGQVPSQGPPNMPGGGYMG